MEVKLIALRHGGKAALLAFNFRWLLAPEKIMDELQNKSVLVVDDDPGMLRAMTKVLAGERMQVTGVSDPSAVVTKLSDSEKRFDLVITDLRMPMFSGRGVLALASVLPELPVIIITAFGGSDVEAQTLGLGAFAFLEKPVTAAQLIEVVKRALAPSPLQEV
jgi:DNA-binding NtrC family response regulator